jgi:hypothetical protein
MNMEYNVSFTKAIDNKATIENFFKNFEMMYGATSCNKNPYLTKIKMSGYTLSTAPLYALSRFKTFKEDGVVQHFSIKYDEINEKKGILSIGYIIEDCNMEMRHYLVKTKVRKEDVYDREQD